MTGASMAAALEREHGEIDAGIERFSAQPSSGEAAASLREAMTALRRHIYLEEEFLFPALAGSGDTALVAPIFVMLREHGQMWQSLDELDGELAGGCDENTVWNRCHRLLAALAHHNMKEERVIYPEADRTLSPEISTRLATFLESGQLPSGWVCAKARS